LLSPPLLYAVIAINSLTLSFDLPARQAMMPSLVPKRFLVNALSLATLIRQSAIIVGPAVAGFLIEFFAVENVYIVNLAIFLFSVVALLFIHAPQQKIEKSVSFTLSSIVQGIAFVRKKPIIYSTMLLDFLATFFSASTVLLPIFAKDILQTGPKGLGLLYAAPSVGAVIAGLTIASKEKIGTSGKALLISVVIYGAATIGFGLSKAFLLTVFFLALAGGADMVSTVIRNTLRQVLTPDYLRGRVGSINMLFYAGGPQLGEAEAGFLAGTIGASTSVAIGGFATVIFTILIAYLFPKLRNFTLKLTHEDII